MEICYGNFSHHWSWLYSSSFVVQGPFFQKCGDLISPIVLGCTEDWHYALVRTLRKPSEGGEQKFLAIQFLIVLLDLDSLYWHLSLGAEAANRDQDGLYDRSSWIYNHLKKRSSTFCLSRKDSLFSFYSNCQSFSSNVKQFIPYWPCQETIRLGYIMLALIRMFWMVWQWLIQFQCG